MIKQRRKELRLGLREFALRAEMDPGNLSRIERGRVCPPQGDHILERILLALELDLGTEQATRFTDQAAIEAGKLPPDLLTDEAVMAKIPVLLRTVQNRQLDPEQVERLIELIRKG
ncbi:MAG: helix-turn-helix transcriptional regulator [Gemmatimonadota bacterium]